MNEEEKSHNKTKFEKEWNNILKKFEGYASLNIHTDEVDMKSLEVVVDKGYLKERNGKKTFGKSISLNKETSNQANIGLSNLKKGLHHNRNVSKFNSKDDECSDADSISLGSDSDEEDEDEEWESDVISEDDTPDVDGFDVCSSNLVHIDAQQINDALINHQDVEKHIEPEVGESLIGPIAMSDVRVLNIVPDSDLSTAVDFNDRATSSQLIDMQQCNSNMSAKLANVDQNWRNEVLDLRCNKHSTKVLTTIQSNYSEIVEPQKSSISIELPSSIESQETCNKSKKPRIGLSNILMDALNQSFACNQKEKNVTDSNIRNEKMSPAQTTKKSDFLKDILNQTYTCNQNDSSVLNLPRIKDTSEKVTPAMQSSKKGRTGLMDYLNQTFISRNSTNHQPSDSPVHVINKNPKENINPNNYQINTDRGSPNMKNIDVVLPKSSKCLNDTFILPKFVSCTTNEDFTSRGVTKLDVKNSKKFCLTKRNYKNKLDETFLINSESADPPNIGDGAQKSLGHTNHESRLNMSQALRTAFTEINSSNEKNHACQLDLKTGPHVFTETIVENEHFIGFVLPKCPLPPVSQKISKSISMKKANLNCYVRNGLIQNVHGHNVELVAEESKQVLPLRQYLEYSYKESKCFSTQASCPDISSPKIVPKFVKIKELESSRNDFKEAKDLFLGHFSKKLHKPGLRSEKFMTPLVDEKSVCESTSQFPLKNIALNNLRHNSISPLNQHTPNLKTALKQIFLDKENSTNSERNCSFLVSSNNNLQTDISSDVEVTKGRINEDKTKLSSEIVIKMLHENKIEFNLARRQFFDLPKTVVPVPSNKILNDMHSKVHRRLSFSESIKSLIPDIIEKTNNPQMNFIRKDQSIESHRLSDDEFDLREFISNEKNQSRKNKKVKCEQLKQSSVESKSIHSTNKKIRNKKPTKKVPDVSFYERCSLVDYSFGEESETDTTSNKNVTGKVVRKMEGSLNKCSMKVPLEVCLDDSKHDEDSPRKFASPKGILKRKSEDDVFNISNYSDTLFQLNNTKHSRRDLERPDRKCSYSTRARMNINKNLNYFQNVDLTSELKGDSRKKN